MPLQCKKSVLPLNERLQDTGERNLAIERSIAKGNRRLTREHLDHLQVGLAEEIRIAALEGQNAHSTFFIHERNGIEAAHAGFLEEPLKFCASLFAIGIDGFVVLADQNWFVTNRRPAQNIL